MRFSADAGDHTRVLGSGLSDRPGERLSRWRKPSASLVDPVCSGYGPAPSVPSRKTAPVAASAVASLSLRPARPILVPLFALATPVGQGVTAAVAAERLAGFLRPIKGGPSQGRHRPLGTAHPHAMANARQAVRPVISRSTPAATSPYGEVEPGAGGDTEPAGEQATGDQRLPKRDGAGRCSRERALPGSAAIRRAAACSRSSSRPPRRAAWATQPR